LCQILGANVALKMKTQEKNNQNKNHPVTADLCTQRISTTFLGFSRATGITSNKRKKFEVYAS
jgi:hypothetical protein